MEIYAPIEQSSSLCCEGFCCPSHLFIENQKVLSKLGLSSANSGTRSWCCYSSASIRRFLREKRGITGSGMGDCCAVWFCPCCALIQETNEIHTIFDLDWPWKERPVKRIMQHLPPPPPRRVPAPHVQTEYKIKPVAHSQPPRLCPVFIPQDFHSLPDEGLVKAEILPYSSVPFEFRPINEDTSTQHPVTYSQLQQNTILQAPMSVNSLPSLQVPMHGGPMAGAMFQGDQMLSQSYIPLHAIPQQQEAAIHMHPQAAASFPMQMPVQMMQGPMPVQVQPNIQGSPVQNKSPTKDLNQALYSGGNDRWT